MGRFKILLLALLCLTAADMAKADVIEQIVSYDLPKKGYSIYVDGNIVYLAGDTLDLQIVDVTDPYYPQLLGTVDTLTNSRGEHIYASKNIAAVAQGYGGLTICDVSDPTAPFLLANYHSQVGIAHDVIIDGHFIYESLCHGLQILNIADPTDPVLMAYLQIEHGNDFRSLCDHNQTVYLDDMEGDISIVDISDRSNPQLQSAYELPTFVSWECCIGDGYGYALCCAVGIEIFDIRDPGNPHHESTIQIDLDIRRIHYYQHYIFTVGQLSGVWHLLIYNVYDPQNPRLVLDFQTSYATDLFVADDLLFCARGRNLDIYQFNPTAIDPANPAPTAFMVAPNYPNPFNASTTISYSLPEPATVTLEIYDILGRRVQTLYPGEQVAGKHSYIWQANDFSSGTYIYSITAGESRQSAKMILIK